MVGAYQTGQLPRGFFADDRAPVPANIEQRSYLTIVTVDDDQ